MKRRHCLFSASSGSRLLVLFVVIVSLAVAANAQHASAHIGWVEEGLHQGLSS